MPTVKPVQRSAAAVARASAARRRGRPRLADRERLLDAAERAIRRGGPRVSLERIAATAGVTKPVLFSHVGDRRALVHALSDRLLTRIERAARAALASGSEGRAALERMVAAQLATIAGDRHVYAFVNGAGAGDTSLESTLAFARRAAAPLIAGIADARRRAGADPSPAEPWGFAIIGVLHMVGLWWLGDSKRELDPARLAAQLTELLWSGLAPRAESLEERAVTRLAGGVAVVTGASRGGKTR
jgi:AcrR family transcriptional regulator